MQNQTPPTIKGEFWLGRTTQNRTGDQGVAVPRLTAWLWYHVNLLHYTLLARICQRLNFHTRKPQLNACADWGKELHGLSRPARRRDKVFTRFFSKKIAGAGQGPAAVRREDAPPARSGVQGQSPRRHGSKRKASPYFDRKKELEPP